MIINLLQEAEEDLIKAASYYEQQRKGLGIDFIHELRRTCQLISESPKSSQKVRNKTRRRLVKRFPFFVLYEIENDSILVVAVAHQRRKPGYWIER